MSCKLQASRTSIGSLNDAELCFTRQFAALWGDRWDMDCMIRRGMLLWTLLDPVLVYT